MKQLQGSKLIAVLVALMLGAVAFVGCDSEKMGSVAGPDLENAGSNDVVNLEKKNGNGNNNNGNTGNGNGNGNGHGNTNTGPTWPMTGSYTFEYNSGQGRYNGGNITFGDDNRSKFTLEAGALTPPPGIPHRAPVTITVEIDFDSTANEMIFTFGPHGSQFLPRAEMKMDYRTLGPQVPKLYYIKDNGEREEQQPDQIDANRQFIKIRLDHFSRYALVHG